MKWNYDFSKRWKKLLIAPATALCLSLVLPSLPTAYAGVIPEEVVKDDVFGAEITDLGSFVAPAIRRQFWLSFDGLSGGSYDIRSSTGLQDWSLRGSVTGMFKTTEEWGFAAPEIFKINLLYGYIDLMTSPPYTDG
jgi:hypothetical protein